MNYKNKLYQYKNSIKLVVFGSSHICNTLYNIGLLNNKSTLDYHLPVIPDEFFNSFVRGYFDGDGCITIKKTGYSVTSICCNSKMFLTELKHKIQEFIPDLKSIRINVEYKNRKNPLYILYITRKTDQNLFKNFIYNNSSIKLLRKYNKFMKIPC